MQQVVRRAPGFGRNPDKKIALDRQPGFVTVRVGDVVIATTRNAICMDEEGLAPVLYIPFADIGFANLQRTDTKTHCPYKGDASYWRLATDTEPHDVMWAYEDPYEEMRAIKDHGAFYEDRVTVERDEE